MYRKTSTFAAGIALSALGLFTMPADAQVTAAPSVMNFQGRLAAPSGIPVPDGAYSIRFSLWSAVSAGTERWNQTIASVNVRNGTFAVSLSGFAATTFDGNLWLEIKLGTNPPLTPRQQLLSVPYALKANMALTVPDASITNAKLVGGITADKFASGILNPLAWLLGGNSGVSNGFLGTLDVNPLEFRVNNRRAARYAYTENIATAGSEYRSINVLGGSEINTITAGVVGATISGGGRDSFTGTDSPNSVNGDFGTIGGGIKNTAGSTYATIGGGTSNTASGNFSVVAGGQSNTASTGGTTIGGGNANTASSTYATVGGGNNNTASGAYAVVAGGNLNTAAGGYSFAAGGRAKANHAGTFVWKSYDNTDFASTAVNQFLIAAAGGVGINTNDPAGFALNIAGTAQMTGLKLPTGAGASKVLSSDAAGVGSWNTLTSLLGANSITNSMIQSVDWSKITNAPSGGGSGWSLTGNAGTTNSHFLGTTDTRPIEFRVKNRRAMRYSYVENTASSGNEYRSINVLGGSELNTIGATVVGATVAGGGKDSFTDTDATNSVVANFGTVSGGMGNLVSGSSGIVGGGENNNASGLNAAILGGLRNITSGDYAIVGGGIENSATSVYTIIGGGRFNVASNGYAMIGGGFLNTASGAKATIGGGGNNVASGQSSTVGGGEQNSADGLNAIIGGGILNVAGGLNAIVGGGQANAASEAYTTVGGGQSNWSGGQFATVGGGTGNRASGMYTTASGGVFNAAIGTAAAVAGGYFNTAAGDYSFAAGGQAQANHSGTFVWKSYDGSDFASTAANQFLISAPGGVGINTNAPAGFALNVNGTARVTTLTQSSDGRWKQDIAELANPLDAILNLRGVSYAWKKDVIGMSFPEGRQIGFIAQEVEKVLPELVSTDSNGFKSVAYVNIVPVLVEAVKTQQKQLDHKQHQIDALQARLARLEKLLEGK